MGSGDESAEFAAAGAQIGAWVLGLSGCVSCLDNNPMELFPTFNLLTGLIGGAVGGAILGAVIGAPFAQASKIENERNRLEAEGRAKAAARAAALSKLRSITDEAQGAAASLSIALAEAEETLNRADDELRNQLPSPFWEAAEDTLSRLRHFQHLMSVIEQKRAEHSIEARLLGGDAPRFEVGVAVLPDPSATHERLNRAYRRAQAIPHFSIVYEQRRTTATLIAGFRSLGQAIEHLGDRVVAEIGSLARSLDCRLAGLEASLEASAAAAAEQSASLRKQLLVTGDGSEGILRQLRQNADARAETERLSLRMLDNIQRRKRPTMFDRP